MPTTYVVPSQHSHSEDTVLEIMDAATQLQEGQGDEKGDEAMHEESTENQVWGTPQCEVIAPNDDLELLEERRSVYVAIQYSIRYHRSLQDTLTCRVLGSGGVGPADHENINLALSSLSSLSRYTWPSRIILTEAMSGCVAK